MDRAINKETKELVSAFDIYKNGSYQNLDKGEWFAPKDSIYNWEELENKEEPVHYVKHKEYKNNKGTYVWCSPYFAIYPGSKAKTIEESPIHKLLKNWLFNRLKDDDLILVYSKGIQPHKYINKIKLSELDINWNDYEIEVTTKGTRKLRADIMLPFNKKHLFLGEGIFFEIQISNQTEEQTYSRSINRALHGYSTCWLFEKDFILEEDNIQLVNLELKINSFSEEIHFAKKGFVGKLKQVVEEQCRFLDNKISETNQCIELLDKKQEEFLEIIEFNKEEIYKQLSQRLNTREALLLSKIEKLESNPFEGLVDMYKTKLENTKEELMNELINSNKILKDNFNYMLKKLNYPTTFGECPKCHQGYMTKKNGKFGLFYGCSNYPACRHIINIKEDDNGETI